jgi:hypothetical protein
MCTREDEFEAKLAMYAWLDTLIGCAKLAGSGHRHGNLLRWAMKRRGQLAVLRNTYIDLSEVRWTEYALASNLDIFPEDCRQLIKALLCRFMEGVKQARNPNWVEKDCNVLLCVENAIVEIESVMRRALARRQCAHALLLFAKLGQRLSLNRALPTNTFVVNGALLT